MADEYNTRENLKHDEVVLEKIGHHVEVVGPYTKRELRRLLLSSLSLYPVTDNEQEALEYIGISEHELRNIKNDENISEITHKKLQDLEITKEMIKEAGKETKEKSETDVFNEQSISNDNRIEVNEKLFQSTKDDFIESFNEKHIVSEDSKNQLSQNDITKEKIRVINNLEYNEDEENLEKCSQIQMNEMNENNLSKFEILNGSFPDELSLNNLYLKNTFFTPIKKALCEIVLRKPNDPVEFLGQWLLHYKVCEERAKKEEFETELLAERENLEMKQKSAGVLNSNLNVEEEKDESELENFVEFSEDVTM